MRTKHQIILNDARKMANIKNGSVDLMITSPPYPMIQMWDWMFSQQNSEIAETIKNEDGRKTFELMHKELDKVWKEVFRVLKVGGIGSVSNN